MSSMLLKQTPGDPYANPAISNQPPTIPPLAASKDPAPDSHIDYAIKGGPSTQRSDSSTQTPVSDNTYAPDDGRWHHRAHVFESCASADELLRLYEVKDSLFFPVLTLDRKAPKKFVLNVATMQAMSICTYKREIIEAGKELRDGKTSVLLAELIHKYCNAIRDMDYIQGRATTPMEDDPFHIHTSRSVERELMKEYGLISEQQYQELPPPTDHTIYGLRRLAAAKADRKATKSQRLYHALGGGLALVVPMLIMATVSSMACSLATTSVFVVVFSFVVALGSELKPQEILAVTAAYAAVLVVFVGTSLERSLP